jgi:radical SAM family protein
MNVLLLSTYDLGRQPFGLASPAAWLRLAGAQVTCLDLAIDHLEDSAILSAGLIAIYIPMHTATRLAIPIASRVKSTNPRAHLCFYGLYAPMNDQYLRANGADTVLGGEFEQLLVSLYSRLVNSEKTAPLKFGPEVSLGRQNFYTPDRTGLPDLTKYSRLEWDGQPARTTGYTEASRGCKHLCRHCPIVPVYSGQFRIVQSDIVLADIRQQVAAGAQHITFGDPDFFNGPLHALAIVQAFHREFPNLTYDVTIKIEHLLKHADLLKALRDTGCLFITSAVESVDNRILKIFDKHHTREDFMRVVRIFRDIGLTLQPTFVAFNPWISLEGYYDLLALVAELDLIEHIAPIQLAIRLLIPAGSRLLELPDIQALIGEFDDEKLSYPRSHSDPRMDELQKEVLRIVQEGEARKLPRRAIFDQVTVAAELVSPIPTKGRVGERVGGNHWDKRPAFASKPIPHLSQPWYC